jgi:hypothetical protein
MANTYKGIALHAHATTFYAASFYDVQRQLQFFDQGASSATKWVRFWADWPALQPQSRDTPGGGWNAQAWAQLDNQVTAANNAGLAVILTSWLTPPWANNGNRPSSIDPASYEATLYRPDRVDIDSAWADFIERLVLRYNPTNPQRSGLITALEVVNEPNGQMRPQTGMVNAVADMMITAKAVKLRNNLGSTYPLLLAPALVDYKRGDSVNSSPSDPADFTYIGDFTDNLLNTLDSKGFAAGPWFGWSQHNHVDIEANRFEPDTAMTLIGGKLKNRWAGWSNPDKTAPRIWLTEGGARLTKIKSYYFPNPNSPPTPSQLRSKQSDLLHNNLARVKGSPYPALFMYYLFTSHWDYDCGLRDSYSYPSQEKII